MANLRFGSAGVITSEVDLSQPTKQNPVGIPAGIVGSSLKGPAFVPITFSNTDDFYAVFGKTDGEKFAPLAMAEWLKNAQAGTFLRVLGVGKGLQRETDGSVSGGGFTVGENQPDTNANDGTLIANAYANSGGSPGRTYFLGSFMSESNGSWLFSDAGIQGLGSTTPGATTALPVIRGVIMAASGVILRLSSSAEGTNSAPASTLIANNNATVSGSLLGAVILSSNSVSKQEFVMLLNGHKGINVSYPNVITASFDMTSANYFPNVFNQDVSKLNQAGHFLYGYYDVHPSTAVVTGSGLVAILSGASASTAKLSGAESSAFITTGSLAYNTGDSYVPNYENFQDRFRHAVSPWVVSQKFGGQRTNLFRVWSLDAGAGISTNYKISIENIVPSSDLSDLHVSFDLIVRDWDDKDNEQVPLEQWRGLNLDPNSDRYIAKVIGDYNIFYDFDHAETAQLLTVAGTYPNNSALIRVEMSTQVDQGNIDESAAPFGFRGGIHLVSSGSKPLTDSAGTTQLQTTNILKRATEPPVPLRKKITKGTGAKEFVNPQLYWGVQFEHITSLSTPNGSTLKNNSLLTHAKYFPDFLTTVESFAVGNNAGTADSAENGIIDSDRFNLNMFALDNIQIRTGSNGFADSAQWASASYVRNGAITTNDTNKTRAITLDDFSQGNRNFLKYSFFLQGGFDGVNIFDEEESKLTNNAVANDMNASNRGRELGPNVRAYTKAVDVMKQTVNADIQLLAIPGIRHPIVTNYAVDAVEDRFDAMYVMDIEQKDENGDLVTDDSQTPSVQNTVSDFSDRALNSSFAAAFFPDVIVQDPTTKTNLVAPPSVAVLGAIAHSDAIGFSWLAPAGLARGATSALETKVRLSKTNMDDLYDVNINPLTSFPGNASSGTNPKGGVVVWGQKTLQQQASALDRINVRRMLIEIRRQVNDVSDLLIFEPNRASTLARFSALITPKLQRIQALAGLERYKVIVDASTTSELDVQNNTVRGVIMLLPARSIEFVSLDFVIKNQGQ